MSPSSPRLAPDRPEGVRYDQKWRAGIRGDWKMVMTQVVARVEPDEWERLRQSYRTMVSVLEPQVAGSSASRQPAKGLAASDQL